MSLASSDAGQIFRVFGRRSAKALVLCPHHRIPDSPAQDACLDDLLAEMVDGSRLRPFGWKCWSDQREARAGQSRAREAVLSVPKQEAKECCLSSHPVTHAVYLRHRSRYPFQDHKDRSPSSPAAFVALTSITSVEAFLSPDSGKRGES